MITKNCKTTAAGGRWIKVKIKRWMEDVCKHHRKI
jgi:hypothetical protein